MVSRAPLALVKLKERGLGLGSWEVRCRLLEVSLYLGLEGVQGLVELHSGLEIWEVHCRLQEILLRSGLEGVQALAELHLGLEVWEVRYC